MRICDTTEDKSLGSQHNINNNKECDDCNLCTEQSTKKLPSNETQKNLMIF